MSGLTNGYLNETGKKMIGKTFIGSFPCDLQPNVRNKKKISIIFNLSKHNEKGTHFVAVFADSKRLLYFDPLGNKCENKNIIKFLKRNKESRKIVKKSPKIQSDESIFCGYFCLGFLLAMSLNIPSKIFFNTFNLKSQNLTQNDFNIIKFIQDNVL